VKSSAAGHAAAADGAGLAACACTSGGPLAQASAASASSICRRMRALANRLQENAVGQVKTSLKEILS
jgi:hypothetical protein